jgi:hypothetical protein
MPDLKAAAIGSGAPAPEKAFLKFHWPTWASISTGAIDPMVGREKTFLIIFIFGYWTWKARN